MKYNDKKISVAKVEQIGEWSDVTKVTSRGSILYRLNAANFDLILL